MSTSEDADALELHLCTRLDGRNDDPVNELLTAVAHYHRTGRKLGLAHSVNFGRPWLPDATCSFGVVSLPYLSGRDLEHLDDPPVRFLWLVPVTDAEVEYKKQHGLGALEDVFEREELNYTDPMRESLV